MQAERSFLQLRSLVKPEGELELSLQSLPLPVPGPDEVLVRIEAAPLNPSDLGLLLGAAELDAARQTGRAGQPVLLAPIPAAAMAGLAGRVGQSLAVGYEGAGTVVATGTSAAARRLAGQLVAVFGGAMYAEYRCVPAEACLLLPPGSTAAEGASAYVNPLTALGMVDTMRREGHSALVHTAAASNLGQMLNQVCLEEGVPLVNIVRRPEQAALLRAKGAVHVCDSSAPSFLDDLTRAIASTGATLAFDATGGGELAGQILGCMETVLSRAGGEYSRYGSNTHKQVYLYGGLDSGPTRFTRNFGMAWSMGGWLLLAFLRKIGPEAADALKRRISANLKTTFASEYSRSVSLTELLHPTTLAQCNRRATGEKFLLLPHG